uniref:Uncharacterized protein n=1 Tax=Tetranychus urticae TaxID=32264 RepID=T1K525_TETUR
MSSSYCFSIVISPINSIVDRIIIKRNRTGNLFGVLLSYVKRTPVGQAHE